MPPVLLALAAAAGLFATAKVVAKILNVPPETPMDAGSGMGAPDASASRVARDLGRLEWDEAAGVYRPRPPQAS